MWSWDVVKRDQNQSDLKKSVACAWKKAMNAVPARTEVERGSIKKRKKRKCESSLVLASERGCVRNSD